MSPESAGVRASPCMRLSFQVPSRSLTSALSERPQHEAGPRLRPERCGLAWNLLAACGYRVDLARRHRAAQDRGTASLPGRAHRGFGVMVHDPDGLIVVDKAPEPG